MGVHSPVRPNGLRVATGMETCPANLSKPGSAGGQQGVSSGSAGGQQGVTKLDDEGCWLLIPSAGPVAYTGPWRDPCPLADIAGGALLHGNDQKCGGALLYAALNIL
eukprot:813135-Prorocentrum_minimum.AAC.3